MFRGHCLEMAYFEFVLDLPKLSKTKHFSSPANHGSRHFRSVSQALQKKNIRLLKLRNNFDYNFVILLRSACEKKVHFEKNCSFMFVTVYILHNFVKEKYDIICYLSMKQSYLLYIVLKTSLDN